jgi:hypothetical protein
MKRFKENGLEEETDMITPFREAMRKVAHKRKRNGGVFLLRRTSDTPIHQLVDQRDKDQIKQDRYQGSLKVRSTQYCYHSNQSKWLATLHSLTQRSCFPPERLYWLFRPPPQARGSWAASGR